MTVLNITKQLTEINKKTTGRRIVLVGGCFDILHIGHVIFLEKARQLADVLIVLLESDVSISKLKGSNRPIHNQQERGKILKALRWVDFVIELPPNLSDRDYDQFVLKIKPDFIATTRGDENIQHKKRQAEIVGAAIVEVTDIIKNHSSTKIAEIISREL